MKKLLPCLLLLITNQIFSQHYVRKNLITELTFETDNNLKNYIFGRGWHYEKCCDYSITLSDSVARSGKKSVRFDLFRTDPDVSKSKRAEMVRMPENASERWYGMSIFFPKDFQIDSVDELVEQWQDVPDFKLGETWRSPSISLTFKKDKWDVNVAWDERAVNADTLGHISYEGQKKYEVGNIVAGKWTDWVFHMKFAYDSTGVLEVWKNGQSVVQRNGPNFYNDQHYPYQKIGIYKYRWHDRQAIKSINTRRVYFYDEIRVGNENATYKDVAPGK